MTSFEGHDCDKTSTLETEQQSTDIQQNDQTSITEEDLLTGPAHNLDDSQYKADYTDPNLDDIFK